MMDRSPGGVKRHLGPQMDRSPGGMKRHLAKQDSQKDVREQRFTAMANALIIPVRIKNAMVPMEKPDSRRRETRFEKVNKGLEFEDAEARTRTPSGGQAAMRATIARGSGGARFLVKVDETKAAERRRTKLVRDADGSRRLVDDSAARNAASAAAAADRAGDAVRELGGAFAPPPSPPVEDLRATRDFADPALRSQRAASAASQRARDHGLRRAGRAARLDLAPVDYGRVDQIIKEERLREALTAQPIIRTDKHIQLIDRFLVQVWPTAQRIGEARVSQVSRAARFHSCSRDEKIVEEGERGLTFFILVSGTAEVFKHSSPGKLATLKAGSSFAVWNSTTGLGGPDQTSEFSVKSKSIRLILDASIALVEFSKHG
ncbi:cGMP-dependent protein kinase [Aureococcus anophagefferens]|nr:cGMP-dependent protein kinase [Aureococcus anophagefferens]